MRDFAIIWLLLNTKAGKVILGLLVAILFIMILGWWLVPLISAFIGIFLLSDYYSLPPNTKDYTYRDQKYMIGGISLLVFASLFVIVFLYYKSHKKSSYYKTQYYTPSNAEKVIETRTYVPEIVKTERIENPKSANSKLSSSNSSSSSNVSDDYDNMRGWDPASEDDTDDNGMSRYMENTDDEGWD